jgi:hypothetical protein
MQVVQCSIIEPSPTAQSIPVLVNRNDGQNNEIERSYGDVLGVPMRFGNPMLVLDEIELGMKIREAHPAVTIGHDTRHIDLAAPELCELYERFATRL